MRIDRPAARVPPAEQPPRIHPFLRETESASTFAIAYQINQSRSRDALEQEVYPFQGRGAVIQLGREQVIRCESVR